jgi:hypothetical protein
MNNREIIEQTRSSLYRKRLLWIGLLLSLFLLAGWFLYNHGQEKLLDPLAERLWRLYNLLQTISQESLWGALMVIAGFNVIYILLRVTYRPPPIELRPPLAGRVGGWLEMLRVAGLPGFLGERLVGAARRLLVNDLTTREHEAAEAAWQRIRRGQIPLSDEARELLGHGQSFIPSPALRGRNRRRTTLAVMREIASYLEKKQIS